MRTLIGKREQNRYLQNKEVKTGDTIKCIICSDKIIGYIVVYTFGLADIAWYIYTLVNI